MIKSFALIGLFSVAIACSQNQRDLDVDYAAGYDAGYNAGYKALNDADKLAGNDFINEPGNTITVPGTQGNEALNESDNTLNYTEDTYSENELTDNFEMDTLTGSEKDSVTTQDEVPYFASGIESSIVPGREPAGTGLNDNGASETFQTASSEKKAGFFTGGLNIYILVLLIFMVLILWQLFALRKKINGISETTNTLKNIAKSQRITKNIDTIADRLSGIESGLHQAIHIQNTTDQDTGNGDKAD